MTPAEVMAKAAFEEKGCGGDWELYKAIYPVAALFRIRNMRAALRALAEMPLSETSGEAAFEVASMSDAWHIEDIDQFSGAYRAALLAQAAEGEDLGRDGAPSSTETKC